MNKEFKYLQFGLSWNQSTAKQQPMANILKDFGSKNIIVQNVKPFDNPLAEIFHTAIKGRRKKLYRAPKH